MRILIAFLFVSVFVSASYSEEVHWNKKTLLGEFVSEGASVADFDGDGNVDLASGPYWWRGPEFNERFEYRDGKPFDPQGYSDHFFSFTADIDGDGDADLISVGFPRQGSHRLPESRQTDRAQSLAGLRDRRSNFK